MSDAAVIFRQTAISTAEQNTYNRNQIIYLCMDLRLAWCEFTHTANQIEVHPHSVMKCGAGYLHVSCSASHYRGAVLVLA